MMRVLGRLSRRRRLVEETAARKDAEARYRTLVEQLPLITYVDPPHKTRETASFISPQAETMLGYSLEEWAAEPDFFWRHLHPADRERVMEAQRAARESGEPLSIEYRFVAKDGRTVWLQDSYTIVRDEAGAPLYSQGFALDVTARKLAERDREALLKSERSRNEELRKLDRMKGEFIALVSHELRTPLTSIRGYLELLLEDAELGELSQMQRDFLGVVDRNSERLMRLVEDLLLTAQAEAGSLQLAVTEVDLGELAAESVRGCAPAASARSIELVAVADGAPTVLGDPTRLGQALDNLVSNALKFTPAGGRVEVRAFAHGEGARIEVADSGVGIPADEQAHLFGRFYRTERAHRNAVAGAGLGLSITKALVEAHGGRISFDSTEGRGTTFRVDLPLAGVASVTAA
jgi:PAS domain S-box-containing protein